MNQDKLDSVCPACKEEECSRIYSTELQEYADYHSAHNPGSKFKAYQCSCGAKWHKASVRSGK